MQAPSDYTSKTSELARALFGAGVSIATAPPLDHEHALFPAERALIATAGDKRRRELATGRMCARRVLEALGHPPVPLLANPDGSACWPAGTVGSIAHCDTLCLAAGARGSAFESLGVDVEERTALPEDLWPMIATASELAWIARTGPFAPGLRAKLLFSAKESVYKCANDPALAAHDIVLRFEDAEPRFEADVRGATARLLGGYCVTPAHVLTGAARRPTARCAASGGC